MILVNYTRICAWLWINIWPANILSYVGMDKELINNIVKLAGAFETSLDRLNPSKIEDEINTHGHRLARLIADTDFSWDDLVSQLLFSAKSTPGIVWKEDSGKLIAKKQHQHYRGPQVEHKEPLVVEVAELNK